MSCSTKDSTTPDLHTFKPFQVWFVYHRLVDGQQECGMCMLHLGLLGCVVATVRLLYMQLGAMRLDIGGASAVTALLTLRGYM
jgi:hypothetical protein